MSALRAAPAALALLAASLTRRLFRALSARAAGPRARLVLDAVRRPSIIVVGTSVILYAALGVFGITVRFQFRVEEPTETWATERRMHERLVKAAQALEAETGRAVLPQVAAGAGGA